MTIFRNPWLWVFIAAAIPIPMLMWLRIHPDVPLEIVRILLFIICAAGGIIYGWKGPRIVADGDFTAPARNLVGVALIIFGTGMFQIYGWIVLKLSRPQWLNDQYWNLTIWTVILLGGMLVGSSLGKVVGKPSKPGNFISALVAAFIAGIGVALSPALHWVAPAIKALVGFFGTVLR